MVPPRVSPAQRERLYGAPAAFTGDASDFLHGATPEVLRLSSRELRLPFSELSGPPSLGCAGSSRPAKFFNPSIARSPTGLCARCAWVAAIRVDTLHQCDSSSPWIDRRTNGFLYSGSAIAVLDASLALLDWTWFLNAPYHQVAQSPNEPSVADARCIAPGAAGSFNNTPPFQRPVHDLRLFNYDEAHHLLATYNCIGCHFSVSLVQLTARRTHGGGLAELRAWATQRTTSGEAWLAGRNQALFAAGGRLLVQPWLGLVATLGTPHFRPAAAGRTCIATRGGGRRLKCEAAHAVQCGASPLGASLQLDALTFASARNGGMLPTLLHNDSRWLGRAVQRAGVSPTTHLLRVPHAGLLLGVGHLHRRGGKLIGGKPSGATLRPPPAGDAPAGSPTARRRSSSPPTPFVFGSQYTHFFCAPPLSPPVGHGNGQGRGRLTYAHAANGRQRRRAAAAPRARVVGRVLPAERGTGRR